MKQSDADNHHIRFLKLGLERRIRRWALVLLVVVFILPSLLTVTESGSRLLRLIHPRLADVTEYQQLQLHWWAPVTIRGLRVRNTRDMPEAMPELLTAEIVTTTEPLWLIALRLGRRTRIVAEQPVINLCVSNDGSNVADVLADLFGDSNSTETLFPICLDIRGGRVCVVDRLTSPISSGPVSEANGRPKPRTLLSDIHCRVSTLKTRTGLPEIRLTARQGPVSQGTTGHLTQDTRPAITVYPRLAARFDDLAGEFCVPMLPPESESEDINSSQPAVELETGVSAETGTCSVRFTVRDLELGPLQPLVALVFPKIQCEGTVSVRGETHLIAPDLQSRAALWFSARATNLQWRQDSWVPGEALQLDIVTAQGAVVMAEDGVLLTGLSLKSSLADVHGNGEIRFLTSRHADPQSPASKNQEARPGAQAAAGKISLRGQLNLASLCHMIPQTLRLHDDLELRDGALHFVIRAQPVADPPRDVRHRGSKLDWRITAESTPVVAQRSGRTIRVDAPVRVDASGWVDADGVTMRRAVVSGLLGRLEVEPQENRWQIRGRLNAEELRSTAARLVSVIPPGIQGEVVLETSIAVVAGSRMKDYSLGNRHSASGMTLHFEGTRLVSDNLRLESDRLILRTGQPLMQMIDGAVNLEGRADATRSLLAPWLNAEWLASTSYVSARLESSLSDQLRLVIQVDSNEEASHLSHSDDGSAFLVRQGRLVLHIDSDSTPDHYIIRDGLLQLPGLEARLAGTLESIHGCMDVSLTADTDYDLGELTRSFLRRTDEPFQLNGRFHEQFVIQGAPIFWQGGNPDAVRPFCVNGRLSWESVELYGLSLGAGATELEFADGRLRTEPIECTVNETGHMRTMLDCDLAAGRLELAPGSRVRNLVLSSELCRLWLDYIAPVTVDAASVSGVVSGRLGLFRYDWYQPELSEIQGMLDVEQITAVPGSALLSLLQAIDAFRPDRRSVVRNVRFPTQRIGCEMRNGMISHDQVHVSVAGRDIRSHGAVGLDRQLNLILDIPLDRSDGTGTGRVVSVPVSGTIDNPRIDAERILQDAGTRHMQEEFDRQLDRGLNRLLDSLR